jgi:hypothetical protein
MTTGLQICGEPGGPSSSSCVNITHSASVNAAQTCLVTHGGNTREVFLELASLPSHQLRILGGLEVNAFSNATGVAGKNDCSSYITHRCVRTSDGSQYKSRYTVDTAGGRTERDWQWYPQSVVLLQNIELMYWSATCQRTWLEYHKTQYLTVGENSITFDKTCKGQWKASVGVRCIGSNEFVVENSSGLGLDA